MNTSNSPDRAALLARVLPQIEQQVNEFFDYAAAHPSATLAELESAALQLSRSCFAPVLQLALMPPAPSNAPPANHPPPLCSCGQPLQDKGLRPRTLLTLLGLLRLTRHYYYCRVCRQGSYPRDVAWDLAPGQFSEGVQRGVCRLAAALPFAHAAATWTALTGLEVSPREVERLTEARGGALTRRHAAACARLLAGAAAETVFSGAHGAPLPRHRRGAGHWAVALDAAKLHFDDGWHEGKVGTVFWAAALAQRVVPGGSPSWEGAMAQEQSYVAHIGGLEEAGERLYAEAVRRGIDPATDLVLCLADGAKGIWTQFVTHFPQRVEILDWYHALEHVWAVGNALHGQGSAAAALWVGARERELWRGEPEQVVAALEAAAATGGTGGEAAGKEVDYFRNNTPRMRYAAYRAAGYPVGSGTVESGCKQVLGARLKGAGMIWTHCGAQAVASLRAELLSDRWEVSWPDTRPAVPAGQAGA